MSASDWAAWYGAVVATAAFGVSIWVVWLDRPGLSAPLKHGKKLSESWGDYSTEHSYTHITISNTGRRATGLSKVWFSSEVTDKQMLVIDSFRAGTVDVPEGRSKTHLMRDDQIDVTKLREIVVEDGVGQVWSGRVVADQPMRLTLKST